MQEDLTHQIYAICAEDAASTSVSR